MSQKNSAPRKKKILPKQPPRIYMDYAAATPVDPRVAKITAETLPEIFANSMSFHSFGQEAREVLEQSRIDIAGIINAQPNEIYFTGSATESNNLALKGVMFASLAGEARLEAASRSRGKHLIISSIEHACVMESSAWLERQGFEVTRLKVDRYGLVDPKVVAAAIRPDTVLVSVMHANNEIGTIEPIAEIGKICRQKKVFFEQSEKQGRTWPYFHTDAAQSFGKVPIDVQKMNIDLLTASSQKIYGPKGAACLFVRKGVKIEPIIHGGGQESGLRSSTVNVPAIFGFAQAGLIAQKEMAKESARMIALRDKLIDGILKNIKGAHLNGHPQKRLPGNANIWFEFVEGESMIIQLDINGIAASTGSACSSAKLAASHVLVAIGLQPQEAHGSLRLSLGRWSKASDINYVLKVLPKIISRLREISPFKTNY